MGKNSKERNEAGFLMEQVGKRIYGVIRKNGLAMRKAAKYKGLEIFKPLFTAY